MNPSRLFIANWKSYLTPSKTQNWLKAHYQELDLLASTHLIALCPDAASISLASQNMPPKIKLGAQNCSAFLPGAHTGDISAQSLREFNVQICIIGHSETRKQNKETSSLIAQKALRLFEQNIIPLICTGENYTEDIAKIISALKENKLPTPHCLIAYEPENAIGSDIIPSIQAISTALKTIKNITNSQFPSLKISLLYGGSVNSTTISLLKDLQEIEGFLLGRASLDFQELKNVVLCS